MPTVFHVPHVRTVGTMKLCPPYIHNATFAIPAEYGIAAEVSTPEIHSLYDGMIQWPAKPDENTHS